MANLRKAFAHFSAALLAGFLFSNDAYGSGSKFERGRHERLPKKPRNGGEEKGAPAGRPPMAFSLLPKSMQVAPVLDMTVFTEMTADGRSASLASSEAVVYYVAQPEGFHQLGAAVAGEKPPSALQMDYFVRKALAAANFRPVPSTEVRPTLMIKYRWGTHNVLGEEISSEFPDFADDDVLERARLVGGRKLIREIVSDMDAVKLGTGDMNPAREEVRDYLKVQAFTDLYFVVISAYDYDAMVRGQRKLYWRTNMTVNASGVSVRETLPALIASATPYLGKEMADPAITSKRLIRKEQVEIGEATMLEYINDPASPAVGAGPEPAK